MPPPRVRDRHGFSLVELIVAIAIIGTILAVALPSYLHSRIAVNENSAISTLRALVSSNEMYRVRFGTYPPDLIDLSNEGYLDRSVTDGEKAGYDFTYSGGAYSYWARANPQNPGASGERYFHVDETGVIHFSTSRPAEPDDLPIQN